MTGGRRGLGEKRNGDGESDHFGSWDWEEMRIGNFEGLFGCGFCFVEGNENP